MDGVERPEVPAFRAAFRAVSGVTAPIPSFAFGDGPAMADALAELVVTGPKRATAGRSEYGDDPTVGDHWIVLDGRGAPRTVIRTTDVRVGPLDSVDPAFAWDEGEGDRSLAGWLIGHERFLQREAEREGRSFSSEIAACFERFTVVWPDADTDVVVHRRGSTFVRELRPAERERFTPATTAPRGGRLPGIVVERHGNPLGVATFAVSPDVVEVHHLEALTSGPDVEQLLLLGLQALSRREGWARLRHRPRSRVSGSS